MTEKQDNKHMYRRLISLIIFVSLIVGGTWAISILKKSILEEPQKIENTDFNGREIRLQLRTSMQNLLTPAADVPTTFRMDIIKQENKEQTPALVLHLAERDMENGNFAIAEDRLRTALIFHGRNVKMYALLGKVLFLREKYKEAEGVFRQQIYLDPENSVSMNNLSVALAKQKKYNEAIGTLHQLLKSDPDSALAILNIAGMYAVSGNKTEAINYFRKAYKLLGNRILFLAQDPNFVPLRQEKEFIKIMEEARKNFRQMRQADSPIKAPAKTKEKK